MNSTGLEIRIPAAIAALPLSIGEKIVLAHIHKFPGCSNARLAELLSVTRRGAESILHRLRQHGYIEPSGKGRARRHHLLFPVEPHTTCGDGEAAAADMKSHTPCGDQSGDGTGIKPKRKFAVLQRELTLQEDLDQNRIASLLLAAFCREVAVETI